LNGKVANLALITVAQVLALSLWFSGTAAGPGMAREAGAAAGPGFQALLTGAVQAGFVLGTLASAVLTLADRFDPRRFFMASALLGAAVNAAILLLPAGSAWAIAARLATGAALAGVYPVGMKLAVGWAGRRDTGLVIGILVGGLTLGSASPHLANALGGLDWRLTLVVASLAAVAAAGLVGLVRLGPRHAPAAPFRPGTALELWRNRGTRLATLGYLGHMWELYAMWAWVGAYLTASFAAWHGAGAAPAGQAALATFAVVAAGCLGCVGAGLLADRLGRVRVTVWAMAASATCCLLAGPAFGLHPAVTIALCLVWGVAVVADSAQFSASVAELSDPRMTGTMLTVQNCLGFALTLVTIHLMPVMVGWAGWGGAFALLAAGPALGCVAMLRLGRSGAAAALAGGRG
jgi:MFS family permease